MNYLEGTYGDLLEKLYNQNCIICYHMKKKKRLKICL
jgi:hypothetical protein